MHPGAVALERDDLLDRAREHLAVVGDHQHRLAGNGDLALERALGGDVEEVVGLVEQQDLGVGGEQRIEHEALALATGQGVRRAVRDLGERAADDLARRAVPLGLELVAAELRPLPDRRPELDSGRVVAAARRFSAAAMCSPAPTMKETPSKRRSPPGCA